MNGRRIGYVRVNPLDESHSGQLDGKFDKMYTDHATGRDSKRPQLQVMLRALRAGDTLVVGSMERLARSLQQLNEIVSSLTAKGVRIEFKRDEITLANGENQLLKMLNAVSQFEREIILERQREGITIAKRAGKYKGRKDALTPEQKQLVCKKVAEGANKAALAREFGVSRQTIYAALLPSDV